MQVLVVVPGSAEFEAGVPPGKELVAGMAKLNAEMEKAGVVVALGGLRPTAKSSRLAFQNGKAHVVDGPFTESKELIAGFWLLEVKSMAEAIGWISRAPFPDGARIDLRPLNDGSDWPDELRQAAMGR